MTTKEIIALAKEKLGRDINEQEAQDYLDGKIALPDEALEIVGGGAACADILPDLPDLPRCPVCRDKMARFKGDIRYVCTTCGYEEVIPDAKG